jgi:hypothetical protein
MPRLVGSAVGCSARACHGGIEPVDQPVQQNEYTRWLIGNDKHTEAYSVLFGERSARIVRNLNGDRPAPDAHEDQRCLVCHTNPLVAGTPSAHLLLPSPHADVASLVRQERSFGVGCEACHGAAERWLGPHTKKGWKQASPEMKQGEGMTALSDSAQLAKVCVGCHVGAPPREGSGLPAQDVNHDLIAAGHPRLNFEFSAFFANLPPHWNTKAPKGRNEARDWAVGQLVSAKAALELLDYRADPTHGRPWPELAEYDCFACHHNLSLPSGRQQRGYGTRLPGSLPWGTWYMPLVRAGALSNLASTAQVSSLANLAEEMDRQSRDPKKVRVTIQQLQQALAVVKKANYDRAVVQKLLEAVASKGQDLAASGWDGAAQVYLALAALEQASRGEKPGATKEKLVQAIRSLADDLAFPADQDPAGKERAYDSPRDFQADEFHSKLKGILRLLDKRAAPKE